MTSHRDTQWHTHAEGDMSGFDSVNVFLSSAVAISEVMKNTAAAQSGFRMDLKKKKKAREYKSFKRGCG